MENIVIDNDALVHDAVWLGFERQVGGNILAGRIAVGREHFEVVVLDQSIVNATHVYVLGVCRTDRSVGHQTMEVTVLNRQIARISTVGPDLHVRTLVGVMEITGVERQSSVRTIDPAAIHLAALERRVVFVRDIYARANPDVVHRDIISGNREHTCNIEVLNSSTRRTSKVVSGVRR